MRSPSMTSLHRSAANTKSFTDLIDVGQLTLMCVPAALMTARLVGAATN
jgi:hypothetical protein